ncbi:hypothetical protein TrLO_g7650 [Triparma laevis f. longispina]|nr:hypothetical protein TrLO_g7650 [Triparma laevis f. longispina]
MLACRVLIYPSFSVLRTSSRFFSAPSSSPSPTITLYQYRICPFCCKTKSLLTHLSLPYTSIEVNPLTKSQFKNLESIGDDTYKKVPVALINNERINGSNEIIDKILEISDKHDIITDDFINDESMKWYNWCDTHLAVRIYPALTETFDSSLTAFSYLDNVSEFSTFEKLSAKYIGAFAMKLAGGKIKKKYGIEDTDHELASSIETWKNDALNSAPFQGGDKPSIADIAVYGVLKGLEDVGGRWFEERVKGDKEVEEWFSRVEGVVGEINSSH